MAKIISPTPEQLKEVSDRFEQHYHDINNIIKSINSDMGVLFPAFRGSNREEESLKEIILLLQKCGDSLHSFSDMMQYVLNAISIPDESLGNMSSFR